MLPGISKLQPRRVSWNPNSYLGGFLAKKSKSMLQEQRGSKRCDSTIGRIISMREIETQRESRRGFPGGKSILRGSLGKNFQSKHSKGVEEKSRDGNEQAKGSKQVGWGIQLCHLEGQDLVCSG